MVSARQTLGAEGHRAEVNQAGTKEQAATNQTLEKWVTRITELAGKPTAQEKCIGDMEHSLRTMDMGNRADKNEIEAITAAAEKAAKAATAAAKAAKHGVAILDVHSLARDAAMEHLSCRINKLRAGGGLSLFGACNE